MGLKDSIFSRLFGSKTEENKEEEQNLEAQAAEGQEEGGALPVTETDPTQMELAPEHALNQLWELWLGQKGGAESAARPVIRLAGALKQPELLAEEKLEFELIRLGQKVDTTAEARLAKAKPRWETVAETDTMEDGQEAQTDEEPRKIQADEEAQADEELREKQIEVVPRLDAQVVTFLTQDQMTVWVIVYPPAGGGKELERGMLEAALSENGVKFGVDETLLDSLPQNEERYFRLYLVAEGKLPENGKDGYVVDKIPRIGRKELAMNESGQIDYMQLNNVRNIEEGDVICEIIEPVPGVPGTTVAGRELPPKAGKKATVPKGRNTELSEDGTTLKAAKTGRIEFNGHSFEIKTALEIGENVDYSTGNINFLGDVHIRGDIRGGFEVKASGNITVDGVVEGCVIEAGGDLVVVKGIKGDNQAVIRTGRSIYARYIENSVLCARENLLTDYIVNCNAYCDGAVNACSGRGIVIGGKIRAGREVRANVVGSRAEGVTTVSLGGRPSDEFECESLRRGIEEMERELERLEKQPDSPEKRKNLPMTRMKLSVDKKRLEQFENEIRKSEESDREHKGQRLTCVTAYAGTEIIIGSARHLLKYEVEPCTAVWLKGEIRLL